ncbi:flavodoxin [Herbidospora sp. NEAU-GS84]|uniref:Flavodoxin n=1 Tax=Herbidospora solisilvae TaxID=2696284 RepID=A0A7C9JZR6_9ACTN|nr:flavodoxin family protein [Herbidospora solisilvae]NAS25999.1 flavodoxin [Herbidospora solisilvae]
MRALVVCESMFGNTMKIAEEVARGLGGAMPAEVVEVGAAPTVMPDDVGLLVVGGPTHAFGMSRASTRKSALEQAPEGLVSKGGGVREWLTALQVNKPIAAAAFDTRLRAAYLPGSAAKGVHKALRRHRMILLAAPTSFYVTGTKGPLEEIEAARAFEWGRSLAETASSL